MRSESGERDASYESGEADEADDSSSSTTGIWYLPLNQRPRSINLHRSEQNGNVAGLPGSDSSTCLRQIGHFMRYFAGKALPHSDTKERM